MKPKISNRLWLAILAIFLALCAAFAGYIYWPREKKQSVIGPVAVVRWYGKIVDAVDLGAVDENFTRTYEAPNGDKNVVEFAPGRARMLEATCPDHNCVQMGWQDGSWPIPIACLPHSIVISIQHLEDQSSDVDSSSY